MLQKSYEEGYLIVLLNWLFFFWCYVLEKLENMAGLFTRGRCAHSILEKRKLFATRIEQRVEESKSATTHLSTQLKTKSSLATKKLRGRCALVAESAQGKFSLGTVRQLSHKPPSQVHHLVQVFKKMWLAWSTRRWKQLAWGCSVESAYKDFSLRQRPCFLCFFMPLTDIG